MLFSLSHRGQSAQFLSLEILNCCFCRVTNNPYSVRLCVVCRISSLSVYQIRSAAIAIFCTCAFAFQSFRHTNAWTITRKESMLWREFYMVGCREVVSGKDSSRNVPVLPFQPQNKRISSS